MFPEPEAQTGVIAPVLLIAVSLFGQQTDNFHNGTASARDGMYIAAIQEIGRGKNFLKTADCRTARTCLPILR